MNIFKSIFKADSKYIPYILSISLYFFWIQCITWACRLLTVVTVGQSRLAFNYSFFYFSLAAGCIISAWRLDVHKTLYVGKIRAITLASTFAACTATFAAGFAYGYGITAAFSVSGFAAGFIVALLQRFMAVQIPQNKRGAALGGAIGTALLINFVLFILFIPAGGSAGIYTKAYADSQIRSASLIFLITGLTVTGFCRNIIESPQASMNSIMQGIAQDAAHSTMSNTVPCIEHEVISDAVSGMEHKAMSDAVSGMEHKAMSDAVPGFMRGTPPEIKPRFIILVFLACLFFYFNIGMQDHVVTLSWFAGGNAMFFTRIFSIIGAFGAGLLCDRKGRHVLIVSSLALLAAGLVSMLLSYRGALAFISLSLVQLAYMAFDISIKLIMADMALYSKRPSLIASLGFCFPYVMRQSGTMLGSFLAAFGTVPVFAALVLLLILPSPFLTMMFDEIRNMYLDRLKIHSASRRQASFDNEDPAFPGDAPRLPDDSKNYPITANYEHAVQSIRDQCGLTARETEVLQLALLGQTIREMSQNLYISEVTIKTHIGRILKKTGAKNRTQLFSIILNDGSPRREQSNI